MALLSQKLCCFITFKFAKMAELNLIRKEKNCGKKGDNACYQDFSLFLTMFSKVFSHRVIMPWDNLVKC